MSRILMLGFLAVLLVACVGGLPLREANEPPWATPAPPAPDSSRFNKGDTDKRPVVHAFFVSEIINRTNGWYIVPIESLRLTTLVNNADKVTFYGYLPGYEEFDPDKNGIVEYGVQQGTTNGHVRWTATRGYLAGPTLAVYAVAENKHGRTVSKVLFVAWDHNTEKRKR